MFLRSLCIIAALVPPTVSAQPQIQFIGPTDTQTVHIRFHSSGETLFLGKSARSGGGLYVWSSGGPVAGLGGGAISAGNGFTVPTDLTIDSNNNVWIVGTTTSDDFPLVNPIFSKNVAGETVGFVMEFSASGGLSFSTYLGGQGGVCQGPCVTAPAAIEADVSGNVYIGGITHDPTFPVTPGAYLTTGPTYVASVGPVYYSFAVKVSAKGQLVYSTFLGTGGQSCAGGSSCLGNSGTSASVSSLAVDSNGILTIAESMPIGPGRISRLKSDGSGLLWSVDAGLGSGGIPLLLLTQDTSGNVTLFGSHTPLLQAGLPQFGTGVPSLFAEKLGPSGSSVFTQSLGEASLDAYPRGIQLDTSGNIWLAGTDSSIAGALSGAASPGGDFLLGLNSSGSVISPPVRFQRGVIAAAPVFDSNQQFLIPGNGALLTLPVGFSTSSPVIAGYANSASLSMNTGIYPGALVSLFGFGFPTESAVVNVNGIAAPILYVSPYQINLQIPLEIRGSAPFVEITVPSAGLAVYPNVERSLGVFTVDGMHGAALNQDGSVNSVGNPAAQGSIVTIYGTGAVWPTGFSDGQTTVTAAWFNQEQNGFQVIDSFGIPEFILYAGAAPGIIDGVFQINVAIPVGAKSPFALESINANGQSISSNAFAIYIQ